MLAMSSPGCPVVVDVGAINGAKTGRKATDDRIRSESGGNRWLSMRNKRVANDIAEDGEAGVGRANRFKRSAVVIGSQARSWVNRTTPIRWRIVRYATNTQMTAANQDSTIAEAFRAWAAVTPLCFVKDVGSDIGDVDVQIYFVRGYHVGDSQSFDGYGGSIAHSSAGRFTHFDNDEWWAMGPAGTATGYFLLPAAIHEFGHLLGFGDSSSSSSVMHGSYADRRSLSDEDRAAATSKYGRCGGNVDAVVDITYNELDYDDDGAAIVLRRYRTTFFMGPLSWLYVNSLGRPQDGEPKSIGVAFSGLPMSLDAVIQHSKMQADGTYKYTLIAIKGTRVYVYDYSRKQVVLTDTISSFFPSRSAYQTLPNNLDSGYQDPRDGNIYFFKNNMVYVYRFDPDGPHSCCESIRVIADLYPLASGSAAAGYMSNVDATYLSISRESLYFIKGDQVWVTNNVRAGMPYANSMTPIGKWNEHWSYICKVDC